MDDMAPSRNARTARCLVFLLLLPAAGRADTLAMDGDAPSGTADRVVAVGAADFGLRGGLAGTNPVEMLSNGNPMFLAAPAAPISNPAVELNENILRGFTSSKVTSRVSEASRRAGRLASARALVERTATAVKMKSRKAALAAHRALFRLDARRTGFARTLNAVETEAAAADKALKTGGPIGAKGAQDEMYEGSARAPNAGTPLMGSFRSSRSRIILRKVGRATAVGTGLAGAALAAAPAAAHAHAEFAATLSLGPAGLSLQQLPRLVPFLPMLAIIVIAWAAGFLESRSRYRRLSPGRWHKRQLAAAAMAGSVVTGLGAYLLPLPLLLTPANLFWLAGCLLVGGALFIAGSFAAASVLGRILDRKYYIPRMADDTDAFRHLAQNTVLLAGFWAVILAGARAFHLMRPTWSSIYVLIAAVSAIGLFKGVADLSENIEDLQARASASWKRRRKP